MIFDESGHLTVEAIRSFKNYEFSSDELIKIADHVSACEKCSLALALSFEEDGLFDVPSGFSEEVLSKVPAKNDSKKQLIFYSFRVAVAASIALTILFSGTLTRLSSIDINQIQPPDKSYVENISESLKDFSQKLLNLEVFSNEKKEK